MKKNKEHYIYKFVINDKISEICKDTKIILKLSSDLSHNKRVNKKC